MIGTITELIRNECDEEPSEDEWSKWAEEAANNEEEDDRLKEEEFKRFEDFNAFSSVDRPEAKSRPLSMTWVIEKRSGVNKARFCTRPLGREPRKADDAYTPTPFPTTIRVLLIMASLRNYEARFFDMPRAFSPNTHSGECLGGSTGGVDQEARERKQYLAHELHHLRFAGGDGGYRFAFR